MKEIEAYKKWLNDPYMETDKSNGVYLRSMGLEPWDVFKYTYKPEQTLSPVIKKETTEIKGEDNVKRTKNTRRKKSSK